MAMRRPSTCIPFQIFTSLSRETQSWTLIRTLQSNNPSDLRGELKGVATFRQKATEGKKPCADDLIYTEEGEMPGVGGSMAGLRWSRKYIWRFTPATVNEDAQAEVDTQVKGSEREGDISIWFVKPTASDEADYLFHTLQLEATSGPHYSEGEPQAGFKVPTPPVVPNLKTKVLVTHGQHLCVNDDYRSIYAFRLADESDGEVVSWSSRHVAQGPAKAQDIVNMYSRNPVGA